MSRLVLGIDIGGTGSRAALAELGDSDTTGILAELTGPRVEIESSGSSVLVVADRLIAAAQEAWPEEFAAVAGIGIGATGIASLAEDPGPVLDRITEQTGAPTAAAIDAVTAHLGALGGQGGAVTVLGTGAISIAHPGPDDQDVMAPTWFRTDGWGHLFGDRGGGAWVGRSALELALRAHDGVDSAGESILESATQRFGPPVTWPGQFYTRNDRAGLLAEFAVEVAVLSASGDAMATGLLRQAGREAARSVIAAARSLAGAEDHEGAGHAAQQTPLRVALTGGLVRAGDALVSGFREEVGRLREDAIIDHSAGNPLSGAVTLARLAAKGRLRSQNAVLWN